MQQMNTNFYGQHNMTLDFYNSDYSRSAQNQLLNQIYAHIENESANLKAQKNRIVDAATRVLNYSDYNHTSLRQEAAQGHTKAYVPYIKSEFHNIFNILSKVFDFEFKYIKTHSKPSYLIDGTSDFSVTFKKSNPLVFLMPQVDYSIPNIKCDPYLTTIYQTKKYSDVIFIVEDKEIKAHQVILSKLPFFDTLFSRWLNNSQQMNDTQHSSAIKLSDFNHADFEFVMKYIYTGEIDENYFSHPQNCLSALKAAIKLEFEPLIKIAKFHLFAQKNLDIFLDVATFSLCTLPDDDLTTYCTRFFDAFPSYVDDLDLSNLTPEDFETIIEIGKKYNQQNLIDRAENVLMGSKT